MTPPRYLSRGGGGDGGGGGGTVRDTQTRHLAPTPNLTFYKRRDAFLMFEGLRLFDQVDLILKNDEVLEFHDLHGGQVLRCLGLWTRFVRGDEEERSIHDRRAVQHGGHENVVPRAVDERDVTDELHSVSAGWSLAWWVVLLVGAVRAVVPRSWTSFVFAFVNLYRRRVSHICTQPRALKGVQKRARTQTHTHLCISVTQLDCDIPHELVLEADGHDA